MHRVEIRLTFVLLLRSSSCHHQIQIDVLFGELVYSPEEFAMIIGSWLLNFFKLLFRLLMAPLRRIHRQA
jgi:hypothetical protein